MADAEVDLSEWEMTSGSRRRRYLKAQPREQAAESLPVVVDLHGSGITPEDYLRITDARTLATCAIVVAPQAATPSDILAALPYSVAETLPPATARNIPGTPMPGESEVRVGADCVDEVAFVGDLIDELVSRHKADPARIHLRGYSGGARLASHLAVAFPQRIASIACIAGVRPPPQKTASTPPVLAIHGRRDALNPFVGGTTPQWRDSVEFAVDRWGVYAQCTTSTKESIADGVHETRYLRADGSSPVRLVVLDEVEHSWPGTTDEQHVAIFGNAGNYSASAAYWEFVQDVEGFAAVAPQMSGRHRASEDGSSGDVNG